MFVCVFAYITFASVCVHVFVCMYIHDIVCVCIHTSVCMFICVSYRVFRTHAMLWGAPAEKKSLLH